MRNERIDIMKGIAILSVALFHTTPFRGVSLFMLPLFFIIAGYLMSDTSNLFLFTAKKTKRLLIPYCFFGLLYAFVGFFQFSAAFCKQNLFNLLLGGQYLTGWFGTFWFVNVFFIAMIIDRIIYACIHNKYVLLCLSVCFLSIAIFVDDSSFNYLWGTQHLPLVLGYLVLGNYIQNQVPIDKMNVIHYPKWLILVSSSFLAYIILFSPQIIFMDIKYNEYGVKGLSIILSLISVFCVVIVASKLVDFYKLKRFLSWCGKVSLCFMFVHQFIHLHIPEHLHWSLQFLITVFISLLGCFIATKVRNCKTIFGC